MVIALAVSSATCECRDSGPGVPGSEPFDSALSQRLAEAVARRGPGYKPHTRHLNRDGSAKYTNRLILETSPYLVMHAHNPVDWYAWGEPAFAKAKREHKPIFLSIGYSTCHWCHVMAEESFEDEEIAGILNRDFVSIKVDREERPDLDAIYMTAVQRMTGSGGWPMTVFLLPDRRPFFGATYVPPRDGVRGAPVGLRTLLERLHRAYVEDPAQLSERASRLVAELELEVAPDAGDMPGPSVIRAAVAALAASFDRTWGGFDGAPKFPGPAALELLLRYHRRTGDALALEMVTLTLDRMAAGGIYDQLGGGFHRYTVDAQWRVPHFEKMLYDNAQLVPIYLEAYQVTGRGELAQIARETLDYVLRELTSPDGGFYAATDADSAGSEGAYFVWSPSEIDRVVGAARGRIVRAYFDLTGRGTFEGGKSVLWRPAPLGDVAARLGLSSEVVRSTIDDARRALLEARAKRPAPLTDRKILVAWNGLMISALARAALVLDEPRYLAAARTAAGYLLARAHGNGALRHSIFDAVAAGDAFLDDYAFLEAGLLDLHEADPDVRWLREAISLQDELDRGFSDPRDGGYFFTASTQEALMVRAKPDHDDALPSGNSIAAANLMRLHELTSDDHYRVRAEASFRAFGLTLASAPSMLPAMLSALDFRLDQPKQIVIVSPPGVEPTELLARVRKAFLPNRVVLRVVEGEPQRVLAAISPLVEHKVARQGKPTAYVCIGTSCEQPTSDPDVFARQLAKAEPLVK